MLQCLEMVAIRFALKYAIFMPLQWKEMVNGLKHV